MRQIRSHAPRIPLKHGKPIPSFTDPMANQRHFVQAGDVHVYNVISLFKRFFLENSLIYSTFLYSIGLEIRSRLWFQVKEFLLPFLFFLRTSVNVVDSQL